jgi:flagellin
MSSLTISSTLGNAALTPLESFSRTLLKDVDEASSGSKLTSAASDPSGLAIYNSLTAQSTGFQVASQNVQTATDAVSVADGALAQTQAGLQSLNALAVQADNDFLSPADRADLQSVANQLVQQINTNAQNASFNGQALLTGKFSGTTPALPPVATTTSNATVTGGGDLVNAPAAAANAQAGAITVSVNAGTGSNPATAQITFTSTATGQTTTVAASAAAGSTVNVDGTQITLGNFTNADNGAQATVQVQAGTSFSAGQAANVQSGSSEGATTAVTLPNGTAAANFLSNIDFSSSASAEEAQGQISEAIASVSSSRAQLGAQVQALANAANNDNTAAVNTTAAASSIGDADLSTVSTELAQLRTQQQISLATLQNANTALGYLNRFFNVAA